MTLPFRETTIRSLMRIVYPNPRGVQVVDQYTLARLPYVASLTSSASGTIEITSAARAKFSLVPAASGIIELTARNP